ncbi:MAG TPA: class I SAM-dependent methyltransferase [Anaeromyxobacteraceae bacterium]|nr:class I SAM-dependent methyltransferase [Anaeromyxobacteraceae bacterium]
MTRAELSPRFWEIFFAVHEALPRQGPGNRACAVKALGLCPGLAPSPAVLDLGCGSGGQTLHLAELTSGTIVALDRHAPSIERLQATIAERGLSPRIRPVVGDMAHPPLSPGSFDLVWSEGALYHIGIENALRLCRELLRPGGHVAFTDAVWRTESPPPAVKVGFDLDYPTMGRVPDVLATIERCELSLTGHFLLPEEAWWDDFYAPMRSRIEELRDTYAADADALAVLDELAVEPELRRRHSYSYAYAFFVARAIGSTEPCQGKGASRRSSRSREWNSPVCSRDCWAEDTVEDEAAVACDAPFACHPGRGRKPETARLQQPHEGTMLGP